MTCIVGLVVENAVYMGADSMSADGWDTRVTAIPKVFRTGDFLIGYTTSFRMGQLLQYQLQVRPQEEGEDDWRYMVVGFVEAARQCFKANGYVTIKESVETGGQFLVGYQGRLYSIGPDFQVNRMMDGLDAVGVGYAYALGAMLALIDLPPVTRIQRALEIAAKRSNGVCPPFIIEKLEPAPFSINGLGSLVRGVQVNQPRKA